MKKVDVIIVGAGASGLMCAIEAAKRGREVLLLDHANKAGKKILMSGGGRCNFTNYAIADDKFHSSNPHFYKSALSRYTQWDFISLVESYQIAYHEKKQGQLFCDHTSKAIVALLLAECEKAGVTILLNTTIVDYQKKEDGLFYLKTNQGSLSCASLVIATGGLSIPTMGATGFGYDVARHFGIPVLETRAGLVPFCLSEKEKARFSVLSGIAVDAAVSIGDIHFEDAILFTHRGISGPAILQISSHWHAGETVVIDLLPGLDLASHLKQSKQTHAKSNVKTLLESILPKRVVKVFISEKHRQTALADLTHKEIDSLSDQLKNWRIKPIATEGYRTAEVTIGGVDPNALSSKTFEAKKVKGLYFIGEVIDVHGWLGGYNFQWAWASGWACGQVV